MQKAWQARTFMDFGQAGRGRHVGSGGGEVDPAGCTGVGFGAICPWRPLEVAKPWQARTFAVAELAPSMTLKSY